MTKLIAILVAVLVLLCAGLGYGLYSQVRANGVIAEQLAKKSDEYTALLAQNKEQLVQLEERQKRLDFAIAQDEANKAKAKTDSKLFRTEIDNLKGSNRDYKQLLETRIPDPLLIRLCQTGYATARLCALVLPNSGQLPSKLSGNTP